MEEQEESCCYLQLALPFGGKRDRELDAAFCIEAILNQHFKLSDKEAVALLEYLTKKHAAKKME